MNTEPLKRAWGSLPTPYKALTVAALALALLVVGTSVGGAVAHFKDRRFDAKEAADAADRAKTAAERDAALRRAEAAEAQTAVWQEAADAQKRVAEQAGISAGEKAARAEEVERETEAAIERAGADPATARDEYRQRLRRLGYLPK